MHNVELPLYVKFGNGKINLSRLRGLGFDVEPLSTINVGSSDIGFCMEKQLTIFFKASDASAFNDSYLSVQESTRRSNAVMIKNLNRAVNKKKRRVEDIKAEGRSIDKATGKSRLIELTKEKRRLESEISDLQKQIDILSVSDKQGKSVIRAIDKASNKTRDTQVLRYAEHLLSLINEKLPYSDLALVTSTFNHRLGNDQDIVAMWVMPKDKYLRLCDFAGTGLNIKHWIWPWAL